MEKSFSRHPPLIVICRKFRLSCQALVSRPLEISTPRSTAGKSVIYVEEYAAATGAQSSSPAQGQGLDESAAALRGRVRFGERFDLSLRRRMPAIPARNHPRRQNRRPTSALRSCHTSSHETVPTPIQPGSRLGTVVHQLPTVWPGGAPRRRHQNTVIPSTCCLTRTKCSTSAQCMWIPTTLVKLTQIRKLQNVQLYRV